MSGGAYDYNCFKIREFAESMRRKGDPRRIAFQELLMKCADAAHEIEWVDSGDKADGDEYNAIDECMGFLNGNFIERYESKGYKIIKEVFKKLEETSPPGEDKGE